MSDPKPRIREFLKANFYLQPTLEIRDGDSLLELQVIDSTGFLELVQFVEKEFGIPVADTEMVLENFESIDSIARFVARKRGL